MPDVAVTNRNTPTQLEERELSLVDTKGIPLSLTWYSLPLFPTKQVKVGSSWNATLTLKGLFYPSQLPRARIIINYRFTLKKVSTTGGQKVATIAYQWNDSHDVSEPDRKITLIHSGDGTADLSLSDGYLLSKTQNEVWTFKRTEEHESDKQLNVNIRMSAKLVSLLPRKNDAGT